MHGYARLLQSVQISLELKSISTTYREMKHHSSK